MAGRDVVLRVRLDTSQGKRDLAAMFGGGGGGLPGAGSPGVAGRPGGVGAGAPVAGGGTVGAGGFNLGSMMSMMGKIAPFALLGRSAIGTSMQVGGAITAGPAAMLERAIFGDIGGDIKGQQSARDQVSQMLGVARGYGLVGDDQVKSLFETLKGPAVAKGIGEKQIKDLLNVEISKDVFSKMLEQLVIIAGILAAIKIATIIEAANPL